MATTTNKTTKAKTKTTKAKTTKKPAVTKKTAAKKSSTAKAATSKSTVKAAATKKAAPVKQAVNLSVAKLRGLHSLSVGVFLLLALAAAFLMTGDTYQLTLGHMAKDQLSGALMPAVQVIYDVELRWVVVGAMVLSAVLPVLYLTKLQNRYADYVNNTRMQPMRWIDAAVTGAIALEVVVLLSGVSDIATLKLVGGLTVIIAVLALIAERQNNTVNTPVRSAYFTALLAGVILAVFTATYAVSSVIYGEGLEWYVYVLYAIVTGGFVLMARNMRMQMRGANNLVVERNYVVINLVVKSAFAVALIAGLVRSF
jgi:hypothetical protein